MQGRRTFTIAGVVALVALAATVGISFLHMRSDEQRKRYEVFIELEARANRANELDDAVDFDSIPVGLHAAGKQSHELAARTDRISWIGTIAVFIVAVLGLTALLALLDRAGRRRVRNDELQELAFTDSLTGLPNRALLKQRIAEVLAAQAPAIVAFLDLDDFKQVNDSLGHAAGDRLGRRAVPVRERRRSPARAGRLRRGGRERAA